MKKYQIGFNVNQFNNIAEKSEYVPQRTDIPKKSVVQIYFPQRKMTLAYYNDLFDLQVGDMVYVDGKLEGMPGRVVEVNYSFKIKLSDYKRVIAVIDKKVSGRFHFAGSHVFTLDVAALPYEKVITWFKAPETDAEFASGTDSFSFPLSDLSQMKISSETAKRGEEYFLDNKVCYISVDGYHGRAIVEGREYYEIEFDYYDGEISNLTCSCFCGGTCKHEFAAMLQLRETLKYITEKYGFENVTSFAAVSKSVFVNDIIAQLDTGRICIGADEL